MRTLIELYASVEKRKIATPREISGGEFADFNYQLDAIKQGIDCLDKYSGVIIADVVGLGKSIIATAIAYNLALLQTVVIAPPHLKTQWEKYIKKMHLKNARVVSSGKIEELHRESQNAQPTLYIIDEAHRYRNENTTAYQTLRQIVRSHQANKVILVTATPYNNHPKDIYALIKLFQTPSRATLNTVDNLGLRFGQLLVEYNQLEKVSRKKLTTRAKQQMRIIADRLRKIIEPVTIRRSRLDLIEVENYANDLTEQEISFATVHDPKVISYDLGKLTERYYATLENLNSGEFTGAKYKPLTYLIDEDEFCAEYEKLFNFNRTQQLNMAKLAQRLFVLRFESSQYAFKKTLENMIAAHQASLDLWQNDALVSISKSKTLDKLDGVDDNHFTIPRRMLHSDFVQDLEADLSWLKKVHHSWFGNELDFDPKHQQVTATIRELLHENPKRKIVIFTSFADTARYVVEKLHAQGLTRTLLYTSTGNQNLKHIVTQNFDASLAENERKDDYDIIVATDALSEGFNLHRAGIVINYDIPYNPTRVIQRIGRINRIDQRTFDELIIYNLFPTTIGENIVNVKGIASLKMLLMGQVVGNDTKILTEDEEIESFFQRQYQAARSDDYISWDNVYRNLYNSIKTDHALIKAAQGIPQGTCVARNHKTPNIKSIALIRRGNNFAFMSLAQNNTIKAIEPENALIILQADEDDIAMNASNTESLQKFETELAKPYELPKMLGNHGRALDVIEALRTVHVVEQNYLDKLYDTVRKYDDLCEAELQLIAHMDLHDVAKAIRKLKTQIPEWYLDAIQKKVAEIETAKPVIIFVEDFK